MKLLQCYIDNIITTALMEDINYIDAAADNLIPPEHKSSAYYVAKDTGVVCGAAVKACLTVTFTCGKPGLFLFPGTIYAGEVVIREIGIRIPENLDRNRKLYNVEETDLSVLPERDESGNKGTFRKVLCITGSPDICGSRETS